MAQAAETAHIRPAPLSITLKARKRLTPFRERTFRAMYKAALADGGADVVESAEVILDEPIAPGEETTLVLVCWVDGSPEDARKILWRVAEWKASERPSLSEAERKDWKRWASFSSISLSMFDGRRASS